MLIPSNFAIRKLRIKMRFSNILKYINFLVLCSLLSIGCPEKSDAETFDSLFASAVQEIEQGSVNKGIGILKKLHGNNYVRATRALGDIYMHGVGVSKDLVKASEYYTNSANLKDAKSIFNLSVIYRDKSFKFYDIGISNDLLKQAAKMNVARAQTNLGMMYLNEGSEKNHIMKAYIWTYIGKLNGDKNAKENLKLLNDRISDNNRNKYISVAKLCLKTDFEKCDELYNPI